MMLPPSFAGVFKRHAYYSDRKVGNSLQTDDQFLDNLFFLKTVINSQNLKAKQIEKQG